MGEGKHFVIRSLLEWGIFSRGERRGGGGLPHPTEQEKLWEGGGQIPHFGEKTLKFI